MDKRHYYRVLGVREGSGTAEIKKAYDRHMRRLALPDYADDPEYVARKKDQIRHAYRVLVGGAAPATKEQREAHFEKWKDAEDAGEDALSGLKRKFERHVKNCEPKTEAAADLDDLKSMLGGLLEKVQDGTGRSEKSGNGNTKLAKMIVVTVICLSLFGALVTACGSLIMNLADGITIGTAVPEYAVQELPPAEVPSEDSVERMDQIIENCHLYDFYGNLDLSTQNDVWDQVEWELNDVTAAAVWDNTMKLVDALGLYSVSDVVWYITGDENFYWETDDLGNAQMVTMLMNPPAYELIAGGVNLYTGEVILNYNAYLQFLTDVAVNQSRVADGLA